MDTLILKFIWNCEGHRRAKKIFKNKNKDERFKFPNFITFYEATRIKTAWYLHNIHLYKIYRQIHQWNIIENPEINQNNSFSTKLLRSSNEQFLSKRIWVTGSRPAKE